MPFCFAHTFWANAVRRLKAVRIFFKTNRLSLGPVLQIKSVALQEVSFAQAEFSGFSALSVGLNEHRMGRGSRRH